MRISDCSSDVCSSDLAASKDRLQVVGPGTERRYPATGGKARADGENGDKVAALNEGVCKMRGADHHRVDRVRSDTADLDQRADGVGNARADIGACGPLYGAQNRLPGQQDGIRIRDRKSTRLNSSH